MEYNLSSKNTINSNVTNPLEDMDEIVLMKTVEDETPGVIFDKWMDGHIDRWRLTRKKEKKEGQLWGGLSLFIHLEIYL